MGRCLRCGNDRAKGISFKTLLLPNPRSKTRSSYLGSPFRKKAAEPQSMHDTILWSGFVKNDLKAAIRSRSFPTYKIRNRASERVGGNR